MDNQRNEGYVDPNIPAAGTAARPPAQKNPDAVYSSASTEPSSGHTNPQGSASVARGEQVGRTVRGVFAGIHGAGESLRGGLNAAVDKAFGTEEGLQKDDAIARKGEREMKAAGFTKSS
ncbi:hypothetical protein C8A03DRAFT_33450 [Achaetomium macrosporum]|uniref:Uncharacterized protein n=1 Tax=Achaetomium macrosporum TaxID=79813 RepID=A0AAN7CAT0_9PEZI|nr:hypothetical protein C8A03DRAFT_33450 [Achaetomium macrosporum]